MLRRLSLLAGLILLVSFSAHAQDKVEIFGGYSYMRVDSSPSANLNGWELLRAIINSRTGSAALQISMVITAHPSARASPCTPFFLGLRFPGPRVFPPFAHLLIGGATWAGGGASDTSFAMALGGGVDARLVHGVYWRVIEGDYLPTTSLWQYAKTMLVSRPESPSGILMSDL